MCQVARYEDRSLAERGINTSWDLGTSFVGVESLASVVTGEMLFKASTSIYL